MRFKLKIKILRFILLNKTSLLFKTIKLKIIFKTHTFCSKYKNNNKTFCKLRNIRFAKQNLTSILNDLV